MMTFVMALLGLLTSASAVVLVSVVGLLSTLLESLLGATGQGRWPWLSNEIVNALQTAWAALLAMAAAAVLGVMS